MWVVEDKIECESQIWLQNSAKGNIYSKFLSFLIFFFF
ncbi:hypothetical protein QG37_07895 [Candidozyma auris]|uniref:Uncharacterized protein n=1 Tax=Candidozyma auris TaxID=498019 RepID=A0A0L0NQ47_CANAR|nr:hypothetical protein QG37_07895 [[Candida] auris]